MLYPAARGRDACPPQRFHSAGSMMPPLSPGTLTRLQLLAAAAVLLGGAGLLWWAIQHADRAVLIQHGSDAWWITAPQAPARAKAIPIDRENPPVFVFEKRFALAQLPERAVLRIKALRQLALSVNGQPVALERDPSRWKRESQVDVVSLLQPGDNRIEARVRNPEGPGLLYLASEDLGERVASGSSWSVRRGAARRRAVVANDVRPYPPSARLPVPGRVLAQRAPLLLAVFLLCALPAWWRRPAPAWIGGEHWPRTAFGAVALFWSALYLLKAMSFPLHLGFDALGHADYIDFFARELRLPRADEGWEMFHPPLFHGGAAALRLLFGTERGEPLDGALLHLLPMLAGLAAAWLSGRVALRLAPGAPGGAALAVLAAGLLPMNVYMATFVSNESLHAAWIGAGLWLACEVLTAERAAARQLTALSLLLGLALVTKSTTGLPVVAAVTLLVAAKLWWVEGRPAGRALAATAGLLAGPILLAGWFYVGNWQRFGDPFVSNLGAFDAWTYWLPPGFHTPAWYLSFGEVLVHPWFSSFTSFWDGWYGSFWADGYASGKEGVQYPNPWWDYESMAAILPLALPATVILLAGLGVLAVRALRGPDLGRRIALSLLLLVVVGFGLMNLLISLRLPYNVLPKAFYALPTVVPIAVAFAAGTGAIDAGLAGAGRRVLRGLLHGYLGLLALCIAAAFLLPG